MFSTKHTGLSYVNLSFFLLNLQRALRKCFASCSHNIILGKNKLIKLHAHWTIKSDKFVCKRVCLYARETLQYGAVRPLHAVSNGFYNLKTNLMLIVYVIIRSFICEIYLFFLLYIFNRYCPVHRYVYLFN